MLVRLIFKVDSRLYLNKPTYYKNILQHKTADKLYSKLKILNLKTVNQVHKEENFYSTVQHND